MPFLSSRTPAEVQTAEKAEWQAHQRKKLVAGLDSRRWIIKHKALEDRGFEHRKLGYQSEAVVRSRDIHLHALAIVERLIALPPEAVLPEMHALRADLGDYLLYARSELAEFNEGDRARQNLQAAFCRGEDSETMRAASWLEPVIENALLTQDYMLECVNKPQGVLEIFKRVHNCRQCREIDASRDIERGRQMDNPHADWRLESEYSQLALADRLAIRETLPAKGIGACCEADAHLRIAPLPRDFRQLLLDNNETLLKTWLRLRDRQNARPRSAAD